MKTSGLPFLGPVGLFFTSLGYTAAVGVARLFVAIESVCTQSCPVFRVEGFRFHHLYYGILLLAVSTSVMVYAQDIRTRWDSALILGIGLGLLADEVGLVVLRAGYSSFLSWIILAGGGFAIYLATLYNAVRTGFSEFRILDKYQLLMILGLVLGFTGFLYFDRPVRLIVEGTALGSWLSSVFLIAKYGRRHIWLIRHSQLNYQRQSQ